MAKKIFLQKDKTIALTFGVIAMVFLIGLIVQAWTEAPGTPPTCPAGYPGCDAPINVSSVAQTKAGALTVTTLTTSAGKLYLDDTTEGDIERANAIIGYNDLFLKSNSAENTPVYISGSQLSFYSGGAERWRIDSTGTLTIGSVPWARLTSFPSACPSGQYVTGVGSSLTCSTPPGGISNSFAKIANDGGTVQFSASGEDTLRMAAGSGLTISYDSTTKKVTYSVPTGGITSTHILDGTIATVDIADLAVTNAKISEMDWAKLQNYPASATCPSGQFVTQIADAITCAAPPGGAPTDATYVVYPSLNATLSAERLLAVGSGLTITDGGANGNVTISPDTTYLQRRVTGTCAAGSAIRIIAADGTVTCETAGIGGSGTAGYISKFTAETTIGNTATPIYESGTNIGIGTTAPAYKLDVVGDTNVSGVYRKGGTAGVSVSCAAGNTPSGITTSGGIVTSAGACIAIGDITGVTAGSGLTGGGTSGDVTLNVGAGTGISVAADTVGLTYPTKSCSSGYAIQSFDLGSSAAPTCAAVGSGLTGSGTSGYITKWTGSTSLGNTATPIYESGSNIGIGTTAPGYKLDVNGNARIGTDLGVGIAPSTSYRIYSSGGSYGIRADGSTMGGYFRDSDGTSYAYLGYSDYGIYAYGNGYISGNLTVGGRIRPQVTDLVIPAIGRDKYYGNWDKSCSSAERGQILISAPSPASNTIDAICYCGWRGSNFTAPNNGYYWNCLAMY